MDLTPFQSGLAALWQDVRQFLAGVRFARPGLLWLSLVPAGLSLVAWWAGRRQRKHLADLGRPAALASLHTRPRRRSRLGGVAAFLGWTALAVGLAGPRWGEGESQGVAVGRDLVVALDLSRSMWAEDMAGPPARWQAAVAGVHDLLDAAGRKGGHRVAVVVFAARPKQLVPLTTDFDHVRTALAALDARLPPPEVRPDDGAASGTRIGAGLRAAVEAHDPRFPGSQDILLVTDGDDPAGDREWEAGVSAARAANVPVHAVGVGHPTLPTFLYAGDRPLEMTDQNGTPTGPIRTRLHTDVVQAIAAAGKGAALVAGQEVPRLGDFFRTRIEPYPSREVSDDVLPQRKDRSPWFLGPALLLFLVSWVRERR